MTYENDLIARYLAVRVLQNQINPNTGITYEKSITNQRTTQEAIDWWLIRQGLECSWQSHN